MDHKLTTKPVTVKYANSEVTIPACTMAVLVEGKTGSGWAVKSIPLLIKLTGNAHDPIDHYCWLPEEAFS